MDKRVTTTVLFEAARLSAALDAGATLKFYREDAPRGVRYVLHPRTPEERGCNQAARVLSYVVNGLLCDVAQPSSWDTPTARAADPADSPTRASTAHFGLSRETSKAQSLDQCATRLILELHEHGGVVECTHHTLPPCEVGQAHSDLRGAIEEKLRAGYLLRVVRRDNTPPLFCFDYAAAERSVLAFMKQARFPVVRTSKEKRNPLSIAGLRALRQKTLIWPNGLAGYVGGAINRQREGLCLLVYHTGRTSSQRPTVYTAQRLADLGVRCLVDGSETGESTPCWTEVADTRPLPAVRPLSDARMNALVGHELRWPGGDVRLCVGLAQAHDTLCVVVRPMRDDGSAVPEREWEEYYSARGLADDRVVCKKRTGLDVGATFKCWEEAEPGAGSADKPGGPIRTPLRVRAPLGDAAMRLLAGRLLVWPCGDSRLCVGVAHMYGGVCAQLAQADGMEPQKAMNARELAAAGVKWCYAAGSQLYPCWVEA